MTAYWIRPVDNRAVPERAEAPVPEPSRGPDFVDAVAAATQGKGADPVVDSAGGSVFAACVRALDYAGRLATAG